LFAHVEANGFHQNLHDDPSRTATRPGDEFVQFNAWVGYRFDRNLCEIAAGVLNIGGTNYQLSRWINFAGPPPDPTVRGSSAPIQSCGAESLLLGGENTGFFRDKIVVIGGEPGIVGEALGKDLFSTPFHRFQIGGKLPLMSGVEVQANGLANLLQGNWITRSSYQFDRCLVIISGILVGVGLTFIRPIRAIITACVLTASLGLAGVLSMHYGNVWFPWSVVAFLQVPVALLWGIAARSYIERFFRIKLTAERAALRAAFTKYLTA
jgi:CHASE2 domain-containing sensor protein